jgi:hypothetical protein
MKKLLLSAFLLAAGATAGISQCTSTATVTNVSCPGGANGAITIIPLTGTPFQTSTRGLLISEVHANPTGTDAPFEFVELIATKSIDFAVTPYTVIFNNNGTANANGWVAGAALSYAFQISTGTVTPGTVIYVGGSSMIPQTNRFRTINTATTGGDGGIGNSNSSGMAGNGGANADGVAVFASTVSSITSTSVPIDAIFWGTGTGSAVVSSGTAGYELPVNDNYSGGKLQTTSFLAPDQASVVFLSASGAYNVQTNTFTTQRTWTNSATFTDLSSNVQLQGLYNFSWSTTATSQTVTGLSAGTYSFTVTDANGCVSSDTLAVTEPPAFIVTNSVVAPTACNVTDGSASVSVSGGTPGYTFSWSPSGGTNDTATGLAPGTYIVTITDNSGCMTMETVNVPQASLTVTAAVTHPSCNIANGFPNGSISLNVSGGTPSYTYSWSPNVSSSSFANNLSGQTYVIDIADASGCTASETITLTEPPLLTVTASSTPVTCFGNTDGTLTATAAGGTPGYTYFWTPGLLVGPTQQGMPAGCYTVIVTDANGCSATALACISQPQQLVVSASAIPASCHGACDGTITGSASGGTPTYTYSWAPVGCMTPTCTNACAGCYTLTVTDANGCVGTASACVTEPAAISAGLSDTMICEPAAVTICASSGFTSYSWSNGSTTQCVTVDTTLCLYVMITDANGCVGIDSVCVTDNICTGLEAGTIASFGIYPNPSQGNVTITLADNASKATVELYDALGNLVLAKQQSANKEMLDISALPDGIYLVRINNISQRVMISR